LQKCLLESESLPALFFPHSSISVNDLRHPHRHLGLPLQALERAFYPAWISMSSTLTRFELNNSFYRLPPASAFERWREASPANLVFAVKARHFISRRIAWQPVWNQ